jgi:hypothetical protein
VVPFIVSIFGRVELPFFMPLRALRNIPTAHCGDLDQISILSALFLYWGYLDVDLVILGGIVIHFPTYYMVFTGKRPSRKYSQFDGALEHRQAQASDKIGRYLITR